MGQDCSYTRPQYVVDDTPPTVPEDTVTAYHTLLKSGEHYREDLQCIKQMEKAQIKLRERMDKDITMTDCARFRIGPNLKQIYGKDYYAEYRNWHEALQVKHEREYREKRNRHTQGLPFVKEKFRENEKEPACQELQDTLYTAFRKNPEESLRCWDDAASYINCINSNAALCFRLGPASKRKQKACKVTIDPFRQLPEYQETEPYVPTPYPPELMKISDPDEHDKSHAKAADNK